MEENVKISTLNDFIFCPRSIYFHNLYLQFDKEMYHTTYQTRGNNSHKNIDAKKYSSRKNILESIDVYSEDFGIIGKIDLFDLKEGILIERKYEIKKIYFGYYLQLYAQYYCLKEMGYDVKKIRFHSIIDNKNYDISLPRKKEYYQLKNIIAQMKNFDLESSNFKQNKKKCKMCIYRELCDYYDD